MDTNIFGRTQAIAILTYHSLNNNNSVISISPRDFAEHMRVLSELDADIVELNEIVRRVARNDVFRPKIAITFDDGFSNFYEYGFPILQRYGFPATVFLVTNYCGKSNAWPSQPAGIPNQTLLTWKQIKTMSNAGISFGSHTKTHPDLTTLSTREAEEEIVGSKKAIEDVTGQSVDAFAYPYGSFDDRVKELAREHFGVACSTLLGFVHSGSDIFALDRVDMYYMRRPNALRKLFSPGLKRYILLRRVIRGIRGYIQARAPKLDGETSG